MVRCHIVGDIHINTLSVIKCTDNEPKAPPGFMRVQPIRSCVNVAAIRSASPNTILLRRKRQRCAGPRFLQVRIDTKLFQGFSGFAVAELKQVRKAVTIKVSQGSGTGPNLTCQCCLLRNIAERSIAVIAQQLISTNIRHEQIGKSVRIVVPDRYPLRKSSAPRCR